MRWHELLADLERRFDAEMGQARAAEVAELTRAEWARTTLDDRLRAHREVHLVLRLRSGGSLEGRLVESGVGWLLVHGPAGREDLVHLAGVVGIDGLGQGVAPPPGEVGARLGFGHALRAVARDRTVVRLATCDGGHVDGRVDVVGADHLVVALVSPETGRPVGPVRTVPFSAVDAVRSL
ncbi:hypothetical protein GXB85_10470 [Cellulomonas sp. APG4]|uniref:hypothetical protein n=1 Tax=Cellulomonas sp. APG4 TaxID=1538656 RepID=UPI00137B088B|nr:hypothetical protein [Cellulomonas sp. APG4]NCT91373.1 hypothetical protein [Cellulomonas sp. APG4]